MYDCAEIRYVYTIKVMGTTTFTAGNIIIILQVNIYTEHNHS